MDILQRYIDTHAETQVTYLEVPATIIDATLNNDTSEETRLSEDASLVYLCDADQQKLLAKLNYYGVCPDVTDIPLPGLSFIRDLPRAQWI